MAQLIFPGIIFEMHIVIDVKIVDVYEIINLTESKVIYLRNFKCAAIRPELGYIIASCSFSNYIYLFEIWATLKFICDLMSLQHT